MSIFEKAVAATKGGLIARQSENFVEFLQNPFPLSHSLTWIILCSFRAANYRLKKVQ